MTGESKREIFEKASKIRLNFSLNLNLIKKTRSYYDNYTLLYVQVSTV